jgi:hypothetical protein
MTYLRALILALIVLVARQNAWALTASTLDRVEEMTGWLTCGACGNVGGTGNVAHYSMTRGITSISRDGSSSEFSISGRPFTNGYWYLQHQAPSTGLKYLRYEFDIFVPVGEQNAPQAIEFECQQQVNGWVYNFAWQADYAGNQWRTFNYGLRRWEYSGIPLRRLSPGTWHHLVAEYHTSTSYHAVYHDALTVDGVRHIVNLVHRATYTGNWSNQFTNAFQLDLNSSGTPYHVYVDGMRLAMNW